MSMFFMFGQGFSVNLKFGAGRLRFKAESCLSALECFKSNSAEGLRHIEKVAVLLREILNSSL